jgi:hypothetical protein
VLQRIVTIAATVLFAAALSAAEIDNLYYAQTIVTGTEEPERTRGFRLALTDVVVKLTGDARLERSEKLQSLLDRPHRLVERFEYEDRMKDIPVHDEQGTRERPHYLRVHFNASAIDTELQRLGLAKWPSDRPHLAVWLGIRTARGTSVLEADGPNGYVQRIVLTEAATRRGLPIALPLAGQPTIAFDDISSKNSSKLRAVPPHADALLVGVLSITNAGYWDIDWELSYRGRVHAWELHDVSFDTALKNGLETCALIFSGNAPM